MLLENRKILFFSQIFSTSTYFIDLHEKTLKTAGIRDYPMGTRGDLIFFSIETLAPPHRARRPSVDMFVRYPPVIRYPPLRPI